MASEEKGGGLFLGTPALTSDADAARDATEPASADVDPEQEAYVVAARDLLTAIDSKDVNALAAALRAAASIGQMASMDFDLGDE